MKKLTVLCLLPVMCICQLSRVPLDFSNLHKDEMQPYRQYIRDTRYSIQLRLNQLRSDGINGILIAQNTLWLAKEASYDAMYSNFTAELDNIRKAVCSAEKQDKNVQHCHKTLESRLKEIKEEANNNAKPCIKQAPSLFNYNHNFTDSIVHEGETLIENMNGVFPLCYWTMIPMNKCVKEELQKIQARLKVFDKNYSLAPEILRVALQYVIDSGALCIEQHVRISNSKAQKNIRIAEKCVQVT